MEFFESQEVQTHIGQISPQGRGPGGSRLWGMWDRETVSQCQQQDQQHQQQQRSAQSAEMLGLNRAPLKRAAHSVHDLVSRLDSLSGRLSSLAAEQAELTIALRNQLAEEKAADTSGGQLSIGQSVRPDESIGRDIDEMKPSMILKPYESIGLLSATRYHRAELSCAGCKGELTTWENCRAEALTALKFNIWQFFKTFFYESIPVSAACVVVTLAEGLKVARARKYWPVLPWIFPIDMVLSGGVWAFVVLTWFWAPPSVNMLDSLLILVLSLTRAATIGCKYATYGQSATQGIGGDEYERFQRADFEQMSSSIFNVKGWQYAYLWEKVHCAGFIADCDLACGNVRFDSIEECDMVRAEVDKHLAHLTSMARSHNENVVYTDFHKVWKDDITRWKHGTDLSRLLSHEVTVMMFALRAVFVSHGKKSTHGRLQFAFIALCGFMFGFAPPCIKALHGLPPFGETATVRVMLVLQSFFMGMYAYLNLWYVVGPCIFFWRQYLLNLYLSASIGRTSILKCLIGVKIPLLDLSMPSNVVAWMAVWRTLNGPEFCPAFQLRANCYLVFTFGAIVACSGLQAVAFQAYSDKNPSETLANRIATSGFLLTASVFVCIEIACGYGINSLSGLNVGSLAEHRMTIVSLLDGVDNEDRRIDLERSVSLLEQCELEIQAKAVARPVRIAFLRADIARVFTVFSILAAVMYADLVRLQEMLGYDFLT